VQTSTVNFEEVPAITEVTGTVRPVQRAIIAAKVMGVIGDMPVTLGQRVKAGDLLISISAGEISARVQQAKSQLNQVQRDLERERDLLTKSASTADMVKNLEDRFGMTQAMVNEAEVMLGYTSVLAPFDGVVARKMVNAGDLAAPGMPLLEVEGLSSFQIEANVPDSIASKLAGGALVSVDVPAAGLSFSGKIVELSSSSDAFARNVLAKISVPEGLAVRSGQFARVQLSGAPEKALLVPSAAISTLGQMERVFINREGRAVLRLVKTGAVHGARVEVLSGLGEADQVVVNPPVGLQEGQILEVQP
jgi:RND family efflux transporter MFP subunit